MKHLPAKNQLQLGRPKTEYVDLRVVATTLFEKVQVGCVCGRIPRELECDQDQRCAHDHAIAANVLDRGFEDTGPNQRWVADFTYIGTEEGWLYFAVVYVLRGEIDRRLRADKVK